MSKGYFVMKAIVFHNQESKERFLEANPDYIHIARKEIMKLFKPYENKEIDCNSCNQKHIIGRIEWSKLK